MDMDSASPSQLNYDTNIHGDFYFDDNNKEISYLGKTSLYHPIRIYKWLWLLKDSARFGRWYIHWLYERMVSDIGTIICPMVILPCLFM